MTLQNRVHPSGAIRAVSARGLFMGNRGRLHDPETKTLLKRRWALKAWLICQTAFNGRQRTVMGHSYTELFFLDEVTALAAGHRPCFECRRKAAIAYQTAWQNAAGLAFPPKAQVMDHVLHNERLDGRKKRLHHLDKNTLPDGAIIEHAGTPYALKGRQLLLWCFEGYQKAPLTFNDLSHKVPCLTPPANLDVLRQGYAPLWHQSAHSIA